MRIVPLLVLSTALTCNALATLEAQPPTGRRAYLTIDAPRGAFFGEGLAMLGDRDGDRHSEYVILNRQEAVVYDGRSGRELGLLPITPGNANERYLAAAGDVDGDGVGDVLTGWPEWQNSTGDVQVFSGRTLKQLYRFTGSKPIDKFGRSLAGVGDVDGDGFDDIAVGADMIGQQWSPGYVVVYSGKDGSVLRRWDGRPNSDDVLGLNVAAAGDIDKDGRPDLIVARWNAVEIRSIVTGKTLRTIGRARSSGLSSAGDADRDGTPDIAIGYSVSSSSAVDVYSGRTGTLLGTTPGVGGVRLTRVARLGDITGDGWDEIVVGGYGRNVRGYVEILSFDAQGKPVFLGRMTGGLRDNFGFVLTAGEDVTGDGLPDILVGAPQPLIAAKGYVHIASAVRLGLQADVFGLPPTGGTQTLRLRATAANAGKPYWLLGSLTGPGTPTVFGNCRFPLVPDFYTTWTIVHPNSAILGNSQGTLDARGEAMATLNVPAHVLPVGAAVWHSYVVIDAGNCVRDSNFIPLTIVR